MRGRIGPEETEETYEALKRLGRYLVGIPREAKTFQYQKAVQNIVVWTDTDFLRGAAVPAKAPAAGWS